jgi:hypothetical protein
MTMHESKAAMSKTARLHTRRKWPIRLVALSGGFVFTLWMAWQIGFDPYAWWVRRTTPKPAPIALAPVQPPTKAIGIAPPIPKGTDASSSPIPLQLILVRTRPGASLHDGTAEIGVVRESPQTYQAGALLENGARIAEIHADYVLLQKEGHTARLFLDSTSVAAKATNSAMLMVGGNKETPKPAKITTREVLTDYIRPSPVYEGGNLIGFQVYAGAKSAQFSQMGLQPGDVIVEIDGTPLNEPEIAWDVFRQLPEGSVLSATVKRQGGIAHVTLDGTLIERAEEAKAQQQVQAIPNPGS